jgi:hypothetical protein
MSSSTVDRVASFTELCQELLGDQVVAAGTDQHGVDGVVLEVVLQLAELLAPGREDLAGLVAVVLQPQDREVIHHLDVVGDVGVQWIAEPRITLGEDHEPLGKLFDAGSEHRLARAHLVNPLHRFWHDSLLPDDSLYRHRTRVGKPLRDLAHL